MRVEYDSKDMLRTTVIPVLLGNCATAHLFAARIYLRSGIVSYICDEKRRAVDLVAPFSSFFCLQSRKEPRAILDCLEYLASSKDYLPIILPCNAFYEDFVKAHEDILASRFIISDRKSFLKQKPMSVFKT